MISNIEKFDEFIALCESEPEKETTPIFIKKEITIDSNTIEVNGYIKVMIEYNQSMIIQYIHDEEIQKYQDMTPSMYKIIENIDPEIAKKIEEKLTENKHFLDEKLTEEQEKMEKILKNIGFKIFINSVWE